MTTPANDPDRSERIRGLQAELQFITRIHDHLTQIVGVGFAAHAVSAELAGATWFREAVEHLRVAAKAFEFRRGELEGLLEIIPPHEGEPNE